MSVLTFRILQAIGKPDLRRGAAIQAYRLATELGKRGHDVTCVFDASDNDDTRHQLGQVECDGLKLKLFPMNSQGQLAFTHFLQTEGFDIIHAHYRDKALRFVLRSAVGVNIPPVVANWGNTYDISNQLLTKRALRSNKVRRIVAHAEAARQSLITTGGVAPEKIEVIYGGVDTDTFSPNVNGDSFRNELQLPIGALLVGMLAANIPKKDIPTFLKAAAIVTRNRSSVYFLIIGEGVEGMSSHELAIYGIQDKVALKCFRRDIQNVIAGLDISVSSARFGEAITGALRESLAMGKAVVSTDVGGNRELIIDGVTGRLVRSEDPVALAAAIIELADNEGIRKTFGHNGRQLILDRFTNSGRVSKTERLYRQLMDLPRL